MEARKLFYRIQIIFNIIYLFIFAVFATDKYKYFMVFWQYVGYII